MVLFDISMPLAKSVPKNARFLHFQIGKPVTPPVISCNAHYKTFHFWNLFGPLCTIAMDGCVLADARRSVAENCRKQKRFGC